MNKLVITAILILSLISCQNYDSKTYYKIESEAISDIILEMTDFNEMKKLNEWENQKLKLYLISELNTTTAWTTKPTGYDIGSNGTEYPEEVIKEHKKEFEENLNKYKLEEKLFADLKKGKIKPRKLHYPFSNEKLNIELVEKKEVTNFRTDINEFGYLFISRIIFNKNFTKGYLHYRFFCGEACAWNNNIEIVKIKGKWRITHYFSGGIA